jgi:hypothetical protein
VITGRSNGVERRKHVEFTPSSVNQAHLSGNHMLVFAISTACLDIQANIQEYVAPNRK